MAFPEKNYVLGKGRVYFGQFAPGTRVVQGGLRYLGNTPEFTLTNDSESLDHFDADAGIRVKDDSVTTDLTRSGSLVTDHIDPRNVAMWLQGSAENVTQAAATNATYVINNAVKGVRYQIGETLANPSGVRGLTSATVQNTTTSTALVAGTDFTVDLETGGLHILPGASVAQDDDLTVTYNASSVSYIQVKSGESAVLEGQLFFIATNPKGTKIDYLFPYVQLRPDGDFALKGDEWQQISFAFEALKRDDNTASIYSNGRAGLTL